MEFMLNHITVIEHSKCNIRSLLPLYSVLSRLLIFLTRHEEILEPAVHCHVRFLLFSIHLFPGMAFPASYTSIHHYIFVYFIDLLNDNEFLDKLIPAT